jgi:DNA helicase-2/ATP-dependent DNA helicase PcrA
MAARSTGWSAGFGSLSGGRGGPERKEPRAPAAEFRMGDDVVHASFGEGVVTAVEPGGVLVVRFASDGGERKLMADYAPLRKA